MAELDNVIAVSEEKDNQQKTDKSFNKNKKFERRPRKDKVEKNDGFDKKTVAVNRISKTVKGGRKMRFNAVVVVGDRNGKVGVGMGKAKEVPLAVDKAVADAKRNLITVSLHNTTIPHETIGKFETSKIIMMPSPEGKGVIAGGSVRDVVDLAGIKDITTKTYGSNNAVNCVKATFEGLKQLRNAEDIAAMRGKSVEEIR